MKLLNPSFYIGEQNDISIIQKERSRKNSKTALNNKEIENIKKLRKNLTKTQSKNNIKIRDKNIEKEEKNAYLKKCKTKSFKDFFEKEKKLNMQKKNFLEIFEGRYKKFIQIVNPLAGIRGKLMNINELHIFIEEIYSLKFNNDNKNNEKNFSFPNYVFKYLSNKYIKKPQIGQHSLNLILSLDYYKTSDLIVQIFSKFLNEEFDSDDLNFYLHVRFNIEKELNITYLELYHQKKKRIKLSEENDEEISLSSRSCLNLANNIYGEEQEEMIDNFMNKIEQILIQQKSQGITKNSISSGQILNYALKSFHKNKLKNNSLLKNEDIIPIIDENAQKREAEKINMLKEEKIYELKIILNTYIKEKELDNYFQKLLPLYMLYKNAKNNIGEILRGIKDLVLRKANLLIKILFDNNEKGWFKSLKLKDTDKPAKKYYDKLTALIQVMMKYKKLEDIPENLYKNFGETLLKTPEFNSAIIKLIAIRFE